MGFVLFFLCGSAEVCHVLKPSVEGVRHQENPQFAHSCCNENLAKYLTFGKALKDGILFVFPLNLEGKMQQ